MKASDLFVQALENEGVKYVFGVPGEENLDLLDSIRKSPKIKFILTRHEQTAGFMAANYGRLKERAGVCLSTLGPGLTNLVTSTAYSLLGGMPSVIISGQKPILTPKQGKFQIISAVNMMSPITKWSKQIIHPRSIPGTVREAFRIARKERSGPVHIELPEDIAAMDTQHHVYPVLRAEVVRATKNSIKIAADMINKAKRPLILIGSNANKSYIIDYLRRFIKHSGIPFFTTQMGKGIVDEHTNEYLGTAAFSDSDILHHAIKKSDIIVNIGHDMIEKPPFLMEYGKYKDRQVIHFNVNDAEIDDIYFPQHQVIGDIGYSMQHLIEFVQPQKHWDFRKYHQVKESIIDHLEAYINDTRFPLLPLRLVKNIRDILPSDGKVCLDNGMYKIWFARNFTVYEQHTLLLDNALASMGAGLPTAMAAKLIYPTKKVVAVCGDGGFMMNSQDLETAIRLGLDITVIILNDGGYGMIKWKQQADFESFGLDFENPDFVKYAEAYGATGFSPKSDAEFSETFAQCLDSKGVNIIDTKIDYSLDQSIFDKTSNFSLHDNLAVTEDTVDSP